MLKIKRPLAVIGFTFFITGTTVLSMPIEYTVILLALFALFVFIHFITKKKYTKHLAVMLFTAITAVFYVNVYNNIYQKNVESIQTETQKFTGYIKEIKNIDNTSYTVALLNENGREMYDVSVYYGEIYNIGDVVDITGKFKPAKRDKYIFSNYSENIKGSVSIEEISLSDIEVRTVKYKTLTLKKTLIESIDGLYGDGYSGVVGAIAYNDKHLINSHTKNLFKVAGMSHTLVVSGLHIGIVVVAIQYAFRIIPIDKRIKNIVAALFVLAYMYIIGLSPSVIRAGFLALMFILCKNTHKEYDSFTALALIGVLSVVINPYITRNVGAMLSYSACAGVLVAANWCYKKDIKGVRKTLVISTAAVIFTIPVLVLAQMYVTIASPIYNVLLAPFVVIICVLSVITPILNLIPIINIINTFLVMTNKLLISSLINILELINRYLNFTTIYFGNELWLMVIVGTMVAIFIAHFQFDTLKVKNIFVISVSILTFVCYNLLNYNTLTIIAFDSGREASFHLSAQGEEYLVLSEEITVAEAKDLMVYPANKKYETVFYCPKEFKTDIDMSIVADKTIEVKKSAVYTEENFTLTSNIDSGKKLFTISAEGCDISFGHGKIVSEDSEYYFLGNDKPKSVKADEVYIFGNTPSWMDVKDIINVDSDVKIKINLKTGEYKTVKDVLNFGYRL